MAFSLEAVFGVDTTGVKTAIKSLRKDLNDFVNDYANLGAGLAVGAFVALTKGAVDLAGHLSDTAANLDINVEALQALEAQHKRNGVSQEQLNKALEKTKAAVISAAEGDEKHAAALEKLGLKAAELIKLPLDRQYEKIAIAAAGAKDQNDAFTAVAALLGEKVGPKLLGSMKELAEGGLDKVTASAREAGHVMSAETIAQLDAAGDAIDDFKKKATIALGEIVVNFKSAEGLQLLLYQFMKIVGQFGAGIADAVYEGGSIVKAIWTGIFTGVINHLRDGLLSTVIGVAKSFNDILPDFLKQKGFTINVSGLEALKSAGRSIADEITDAVSKTSPGTFKKEVGEFWDKRIGDQKQIVEEMNRVDFGKAAVAISDAGHTAGAAVTKGAAKVAEAGKSAGEDIAAGGEEAAAAFDQAFNEIQKSINIIVRGGAAFNNASDEALSTIVTKNRQGAIDLRARSGGNANPSRDYANYVEAGRLEAEAVNAQNELDLRRGVRGAFNRGGNAEVYRQFSSKDPVLLDRLIDQFAKQLPESVKTSNSLDRIERGLVQNKIIPGL